MSPSGDKDRAVEIFRRAVQLDEVRRSAFLDHECAGDPELTAEVERLLLLEEVTADFLPDSGHPEFIGPYRILDVLGEGGMGIVYLAEQESPVRRRVAVKVIKLGMDTREVVARFEAERQALAMLNHPNIATVHDAGGTDEGRPYFVMELFQGIPITEFCDRHRLEIDARLGLFVQACRGVQHAHHRGIVHRDLKPSNLLVGTVGDVHVVKIIDFGVAKATNQRLTEKTLYTELGRAVGTPAYMSPEQAEMTAEEVDHRTDIFSLGILLYELLVGETPLDTETLSKAAFDEVLRRIREDEPATPSTRWSRLNVERTTELAARRRTSAAALTSKLRGDLDWIAMKALDKERGRRYGNASELAGDVVRHLRHDPVMAGPASLGYRLRKYLTKHRGPVAAAVTIVAALTVGLVMALWAWVGEQEANRKLEGVNIELAEATRVATENAAERAEQLAEVMRLANIQRLREYEAEAEELWPASPDNAPRFERWLAKAGELANHLDRHRADLERLRASALEWTEDDRRHDRNTHPQAVELADLDGDLQEMEQALAELRAAGHTGAEVTVLPPADGEPRGDAKGAGRTTCYFRRAFELADGTTPSTLRLRIAALHGVSVWLNGAEVHRRNLPEGEVEHDTLAQLVLQAAQREETIEISDPADRLRPRAAGGNVLAVEVHPASPYGRALFFDVELTAIGAVAVDDAVDDAVDNAVDDAAEPTSLIDAGARWRYHDGATAPDTAWRDPAWDDSGWREGPAPLGYGFTPLDPDCRAAELPSRIVAARERRAALDVAVSRRRTWRFPDTETQWRHDTLAGLVVGLTALRNPDPSVGRIAAITRRLEFARTVRRDTVEGGVAREKWREAIASIADREASPRYDGLELAPQEGLIPLGCDPASGLWEFAHLQSGAPAVRDENDALVVTEETGIVFVLLPRASFRMGAVTPEANTFAEETNLERHAEGGESPVTAIALDEFFLSKYEMTQGQWSRLTGTNPSYLGPGSRHGGKYHTLVHPVENVDWATCGEVLVRFGLVLPTEAQWEYGARAGTTTPWWTGDDPRTLQGAANIVDRHFSLSAPRDSFRDDAIDDGYSRHAPVTAFRANGFGLHGIIGNVFEWCRERYSSSYSLEPRPGDGERPAARSAPRAVRRGGSFYYTSHRARSAFRDAHPVALPSTHTGLRPARAVDR